MTWVDTWLHFKTRAPPPVQHKCKYRGKMIMPSSKFLLSLPLPLPLSLAIMKWSNQVSTAIRKYLDYNSLFLPVLTVKACVYKIRFPIKGKRINHKNDNTNSCIKPSYKVKYNTIAEMLQELPNPDQLKP